VACDFPCCVGTSSADQLQIITITRIIIGCMSTDFTNPPRDRSQLMDMLYASALREPLGNVRFLPFILKREIDRFLSRLDVGRFRSQVMKLDEYYLIRLQRQASELGAQDETVAGDFALFHISDAVWCFCSIENTVTVNKTAIAAIQQYASQASLIYISTREFRRIFDRLAEQKQRIQIVQHSEYNRQESNVNYLRETKDYRSVFAELASKDAVVRRIVAEVYAESRQPVALFAFNNNGLLSLREGAIHFFFDQLVAEVARIGNAKNLIFANRERERLQLHPLELSFEDNILSDKVANFALVDALSSISKSAIGVFHANPYIHVLYTDFRDGSSFNVYSTSDSTLMIVPSTRASVSALMKLYRGISEKFADCEIAEAPRRPPTLGEFFEG